MLQGPGQGCWQQHYLEKAMYDNRSCINFQRLLPDLKASDPYMLHVWGHSNSGELPAAAGDLRGG